MPDLPNGMQLTPSQQEARKRAEKSMVDASFSMAARKPFAGLYAAAMDVTNVKPGDVIQIDVDRLASPGPFSALPSGDYYASAVLDIRHDFATTGASGPDDVISSIQLVKLGKDRPRLTLTRRNDTNASNWPPLNPQMSAVREATRDVSFLSPSFSNFYGKPTRIRGYVLLPPDYDQNGHVDPLVYDFAQYGYTLDILPVFQVL